MKKKWIVIIPILLYVACLVCINSAFKTLFTMQGEISPEQFEQIQNTQQIMSIGKTVSLFLVLISFSLFGYFGLREGRMKWLNGGIGAVVVEVLAAVLFSKICTGSWLVYAEQFQFSRWFWIILFILWLGFFIGIKRKQRMERN
ncbi:hypothetical protein [Dubosiella newyorkensis]|uniref:hypothetical protein n=1 Tax=Dubosiella newyorkensis TaxID=1862672 RepID=UPI002573E736|nr:hypothetical protein [Dubosiella newyorkensis]